MSQPIVFVLEVEPFNSRDFDRTLLKVGAVVQELREDGVQVRALHAALSTTRNAILEQLSPA